MGLSLVTLEDYRFQILHEVDEVEKSAKFPANIVNTWIHKDVCGLVLRLGAQINQIYRATASIAVASNAGAYEATADHTASAVTVTGFTGLTPDAWIGGSILVVEANVFYAAQITDNDATTVTISVGTDLPALSSDPVILTANNAGSVIPLSSLLMINYADPIWELVDPSGFQIPKINVDLAQNVVNVPSYDGTTHYYVKGSNIVLALGSGSTASGSYTVGYYKLPVEATVDANYIDLPLEYHDLAQKLTMIRILKKKGNENALYSNMANLKESELDKAFRRIDEVNMTSLRMDQMTGERRQGPPGF
jgi:hypothetical protein